eukprot:7237103-Pyramimonas_sp.AAC.1
MTTMMTMMMMTTMQKQVESVESENPALKTASEDVMAGGLSRLSGVDSWLPPFAASWQLGGGVAARHACR